MRKELSILMGVHESIIEIENEDFQYYLEALEELEYI